MRNQTLNNAFPIVAAALGNKFGVKISVGGDDVYTTGDRIHLPALDTDDSNIKDVAWGYLAHEAAHVRFTDFGEFRNAATNPLRKHIVNILEDIRIERLMQMTYPGTKRTTEKVVEHLVQTGGFQMAAQGEQVHPAAILSQFLLFRLRNDILCQRALSSYADNAEALLEATFPVGAVTRLAGLLSEVPQLQVTRDCVRLADRILHMIEEEHEKEQDKVRQQQQSSNQYDSEDPSSKSQPGQSNTDQDKDTTDTDSDNSQQDSPSQGDNSQLDQDTADSQLAQQPGDSEPDDKDQDQSPLFQPGDADDQDSQAGRGHDNAIGSNTDNSQDQDSEQLTQNLASVLSARDNDMPDDLFEAVKRLLGSQPRNCYDADVCMPLAMDPERNPSLGNALMNRALTDSGKIRASLQGLVQSSRHDRPVLKRSGNRIDGRKLSRLVQGDSRVFERKHHHQAPNTAIHLLIDGSPSMKGSYGQNFRSRLIDIAMASGMALALALEGIPGVNPAVTRFPFGDTDNVVPLLKHGQKVRPNAPAFLAITSGGTPLHSALWYAAASVLATREERKVIMVLTDGQPDDDDAAKAIIRRCEATGIELIGVGICFDTSHLFGNSICINNASELRTEIFRISRDLLLAA